MSLHFNSAGGGGRRVLMPALNAASILNAAVLGNLAPPAEASSVNESGSMRTRIPHTAVAAAADASTQVSVPHLDSHPICIVARVC